MSHLASPAGLFVTSEGQRGIENVVAVDPHCSGAKLFRHAVGFADVARPNSSSKPYSLSFARGMISSGSVNGIAVTTGPKISSRTTFMFSFVSTNTVGSTKYPRSPALCPPATAFAPSENPDSKYPQTRFICSSDTSGPICVSGSRPAPTLIFRACSATPSTTSS